MNLLGIAGRKGHGKDTFYACIDRYTRSIKQHYHRLAFADALKDEVSELIGSRMNVENKNHPFWRNAHQFWGQYQKDHTGNQYYWCVKVKKLIDHLSKGYCEGCCVTDVRFDLEAEFLKQLSGGIFLIINSRIPNDAQSNHISETSIDDIESHYVIHNEGSIEELEELAKWVVDNYDRLFLNIYYPSKEHSKVLVINPSLPSDLLPVFGNTRLAIWSAQDHISGSGIERTAQTLPGWTQEKETRLQALISNLKCLPSNPEEIETLIQLVEERQALALKS